MSIQLQSCGTSLEHCTNKVGNFGPDAPVQTPVSVPQTPVQPQIPVLPTSTGGRPNFQPTPQAGATVGGTGAFQENLSPQTAPHGTNKKIIGYYGEIYNFICKW